MVILTESNDEGVFSVIASARAKNLVEFVEDMNSNNVIVSGMKDAQSYFEGQADESWADGITVWPMTLDILEAYSNHYCFIDGSSFPRVQIFESCEKTNRFSS